MSPLGPISEVAAPLIEDRSVGHSGLDLAHVEFFAFRPPPEVWVVDLIAVGIYFRKGPQYYLHFRLRGSTYSCNRH